jgi:hypothetical protein
MNRLVVALLVLGFLAAGCGKDSKKSKSLEQVTVGGFTLSVAPEWSNEGHQQGMGEGAVMIRRKEPRDAYLMLTPLPFPLPRDPTLPADCEAHGKTLPMTVTLAQVEDYPFGKGCHVEASHKGKAVMQVVLAVEGRGLLANCLGDGVAACKQMIDSIKLL